jgi:pentatricopeptide repeat protein
MLKQLFQPKQAQTLAKAIQRQNLPAFREAYSKQRKAQTLQLQDVRDALKWMSDQRRTRLAQHLFNDIERLFGESQTRQDHRLLLKAMASQGRTADVVKWIRGMPASFGVKPGPAEWLLALESCLVIQGSTSRADAVRLVAKEMAKAGVLPALPHYNALLKVYLDARDAKNVKDVLAQMKSRGVAHDAATCTILLDGFTEQGNEREATQAYNRLRDYAGDTHSWNARLGYQSIFHGQAAALKEWQAWQDSASCPPANDRTLTHFVAMDKSALYGQPRTPLEQADRILQRATDATRLEVQPHAVRILITRLVDEAPTPAVGLQTARAYYEELTQGSSSIAPDPLFVQPLLQSACIELQLAEAKKLYEDLESPDIGTYHILLQACVRSGPEGVQWALQLLEDMRQDDLAFDSIDTPFQIMLDLLPHSDSPVVAFKIYAFTYALDPKSFQRAHYIAVLSALAQLKCSIPLDVFLEIFKDMRTSGCPPDSRAYNSLLKYYSKTQPNVHNVRQLHNLIKLDNQYDPDTVLLNGLMTAYGFVREYQAAFRVWESMLANRNRSSMTIDNVSITVILDVCAWAGSYTNAQSIWRARKADPSLPLDKRNWDTWVECLGRLRAIEEAETVVFEEMPALGDGLQPTQETLDVLVKFARRASDEDAARVVARAQQQFPHLQLPPAQAPPLVDTTAPAATAPPFAASRVFTVPAAAVKLA